MNAKLGYVYFLTGCLLALIALMVWHPITQDSRTLIEGVLSAFLALLGSAVHSVFRADGPAVPAATSASPNPPRDAASPGPIFQQPVGPAQKE